MDIERFSGLVADIYDAALDPPKWRKVLRGVCEAVDGSPSASLCWQDAAKKSGHSYFAWGGDPSYAQLYWSRHNNLNPLTSGAGRFAIGEVFRATDIVPREQLVETPFYKEWMLPQGWSDVLCANLDKSATGRAVFIVARPARDGLADEEMRRRMRLLVPHVQRAVSVGRLIDVSRVEAAALTDTLDGLDAAMFLVDSSGRLVHANTSGQAMLNDGNVLYANGRLVARDAQSDETLRNAFRTSGNGNGAPDVRDIAVQLAARNGNKFVTHVLPLRSGARRQAGVPYSAVAAVFVQRAGRSITLPFEMLARQYQLTPGELRILIAMIDAGGVPDIAAALKLSQATVRTHLRHVFEKTGVRRQADLVKLITSYPAPILAQSCNGKGAERHNGCRAAA